MLYRILRTTVLLVTAFASLVHASSALAHSPTARIEPNDNTRPAGTLTGTTLELSLRAAVGEWRPEGPEGPALEVQAFGEAGDVLRIPSPLIRAREGTTIAATVRNDLRETLRVHGLCARDGDDHACAPLEIPPGAQRDVRFTLTRAGTYHYWGSTTGLPQAFRGGSDTQLSGALIVDPADAPAEADRVLVITEWTSLTEKQLAAVIAADDPGAQFELINPRIGFFINGLSWPATERFAYQRGERVRWRVINLSTQRHPMHLHGFYYQVESLGDGNRDTVFATDSKQQVVTQLMNAGMTMTITWVPEREGNWLFHCHVMHHVSPDRRLGAAASAHAGHHDSHDPAVGMAGMVLGVTVTAPSGSPATSAKFEVPPRRMTLVMQPVEAQDVNSTTNGFALAAGSDPFSVAQPQSPGPTLVLRRGEPVEITLVNRMREGTAIHWHGMELDSFYDGVHGWSGVGSRVTPLIEPGGTFIVRFTPPRTGTFIYHTHLHDDRQLPSGLYGALLVVDSSDAAARFDPATDHVFVIGRGGDTAKSIVLNGSRQPLLAWKAGARHRVRLINITTDDIFTVTLSTKDGLAKWKPLTKDGAPLPPSRCVLGQASQTIAVGETYDFEVEVPPGRQTLWLEVRGTGGKWKVQGQIVAR